MIPKTLESCGNTYLKIPGVIVRVTQIVGKCGHKGCAEPERENLSAAQAEALVALTVAHAEARLALAWTEPLRHPTFYQAVYRPTALLRASRLTPTGKLSPDRSFHSLRHTYASLCRSGNPAHRHRGAHWPPRRQDDLDRVRAPDQHGRPRGQYGRAGRDGLRNAGLRRQRDTAARVGV